MLVLVLAKWYHNLNICTYQIFNFRKQQIRWHSYHTMDTDSLTAQIAGCQLKPFPLYLSDVSDGLTASWTVGDRME